MNIKLHKVINFICLQFEITAELDIVLELLEIDGNNVVDTVDVNVEEPVV
jgi:hypothetical protein